jgi:hypothetical protein
MRIRRLLPLALAYLWSTLAAAQVPLDQPVPEPTPAPTVSPEPDAQVTIVAGGLVSMGSDAGTAAAPFVRVGVDFPLVAGDNAPRVQVQADLGALPGEAAPQLQSAETFRSIEFRVGLVQPLGRLWFNLYADVGFASRLPGDPEPRDKTARFASGGLKFAHFGRGELKLGLGSDQRLDGTYRMVAVISGAVKLYQPETGPLRSASLQLVGEALLGLDPYGVGAARDVVRVGVAVGR